MPKATLQQLSKLLNGFRKDKQVNIFRKDGITHIRVMSDDYVSMLECASNTGGDDYEEIAIKSIAITKDELTGDKQDKKILVARLPEMGNHSVNFTVDGSNLANCIKKHSEVINGLRDDGTPYSKTALAINENMLYLTTKLDDVGIKEEHRTILNITETGSLGEVLFDANKLYRTIFKYIAPQDLNILIVSDRYPIEIMFNVDGYQCHYIQAPMIEMMRC